MTDALERAVHRPVSRETRARLEAFADLIRNGSSKQNLISSSSLETLWERHILDSAQLIRFEPAPGCSWVDVGSGAGLPGIILAALAEGPVTLVEPRRLRANFLQQAVDALRLPQATVVAAKIERVTGNFDVITARAVAPLARFLSIARHLSHPGTVWVLPKGRNAKSELAEARRSWHCDVRAEPSATDPDSQILVLRNVRAKSNR